MAGLTDAEGHIGIAKISSEIRKNAKSPEYHEKFQIKMAGKKAISVVSKFFGGKLRFERKGQAQWKDQWRYIKEYKNASKIIQALQPFLLVKKTNAYLALELRKRIDCYQKKVNGWNFEKVSEKELGLRNTLWKTCKKFLHSGNFEQKKPSASYLNSWMKQLTEKEILAYLAGIIDGEGTFTIKKQKGEKANHNPTYREKVHVKMADGNVIMLLKKMFGGCTYTRDYENKKWLISYVYEGLDSTADGVARKLLPFLQETRKQAEIIIKLRKRKNRYGISELSSRELKARELLKKEINRLNKLN